MAHRLAGYQPRVAEHGVLYRVIDEHLEAFLDAAAQHADGHRLPKFVEQEPTLYSVGEIVTPLLTMIFEPNARKAELQGDPSASSNSGP